MNPRLLAPWRQDSSSQELDARPPCTLTSQMELYRK